MKRDREMEKDRQKLQYTAEREGGRQAGRKGIRAERHFGWGKVGRDGEFELAVALRGFRVLQIN